MVSRDLHKACFMMIRIENLYFRMCFHLILYLEFSGLFYYSVIKFLWPLIRSLLFALSCVSEIYIITLWRACQQLFLFFLKFFFIIKSRISNGERGIWTLAPVARPTPLAGAPLQPLEYFSSRRFLYRQQELVYQFVAIMSTIFLNFIAFFYKFILYSISIYNSHSLLQYIDVFLFHFILWCKCK